jgi:hypothetical protein
MNSAPSRRRPPCWNEVIFDLWPAHNDPDGPPDPERPAQPKVSPVSVPLEDQRGVVLFPVQGLPVKRAPAERQDLGDLP